MNFLHLANNLQSIYCLYNPVKLEYFNAQNIQLGGKAFNRPYLLKAFRRFSNLFVVFVHFKRQVFLFAFFGMLA